MKIEIDVDFLIGDVVYLKTDEKQLERLVVKYTVNSNGVAYYLAQGITPEVFAFSCEISKEKSYLNNSKIGFGK